MHIFLDLLFISPLTFFLAVLVVTFSICCHEYCHARVALWQGDPTVIYTGHLTLNPLKQMGAVSLVMLLLFGIAWGSVPVYPPNFKNKYSEWLVALAGPAANIILFLVFGFLLLISLKLSDNRLLIGVLSYATEVNLVLAFFNLLPIPGLDGGIVTTKLLPRFKQAENEWVKGTMIIIFILLFLSIDKLYLAASFVTDKYLMLMAKIWIAII